MDAPRAPMDIQGLPVTIHGYPWMRMELIAMIGLQLGSCHWWGLLCQRWRTMWSSEDDCMFGYGWMVQLAMSVGSGIMDQ